MSQPLPESSLLSTFDWIWEKEDFLFPDAESPISLFDEQLLISIPSNSDNNFTNPSVTDSPEEASPAGRPASPEAGNIPETNEETKSNPVTKKRKTWGQELPVPTTNLPPRKRAKTDAEKEQRRIERVLRNRAAAQSSRERKQKEVESLKAERARLAESNSELKEQVLAQEAAHTALCKELENMKKTLRRYEEFQKVEARGISSNSIAIPVGPLILTSYFEAPDPSVDEDENLFSFLNSEVGSPAWTADPSILKGLGFPGQSESFISLDLFS
ncbi:hypothetical protein HOY82DRAFT_537437 [Tuber indicum]|nr:hypothetical protein HOY82DRAFT_537436 [Tuber indicum]KAG0134420.1 hypothetical protein HOY82DRAFT_537437 [Tuber indicum]